jgi:hypothetical protein
MLGTQFTAHLVGQCTLPPEFALKPEFRALKGEH